jgi:hypothetical protein
MNSGRVGNSCPASDTRRVTLVTKPVISHARGKDLEVRSFVTQILRNSQPNHDGDRKAFKYNAC